MLSLGGWRLLHGRAARTLCQAISRQRMMNQSSVKMTSTKMPTVSHTSTPKVLTLAAELFHVLVVLCYECCGLAESAARTSASSMQHCAVHRHEHVVSAQESRASYSTVAHVCLDCHRCGIGLRSIRNIVAPDADLRNQTMEMIQHWHKPGSKYANA